MASRSGWKGWSAWLTAATAATVTWGCSDEGKEAPRQAEAVAQAAQALQQGDPCHGEWGQGTWDESTAECGYEDQGPCGGGLTGVTGTYDAASNSCICPSWARWVSSTATNLEVDSCWADCLSSAWGNEPTSGACRYCDGGWAGPGGIGCSCPAGKVWKETQCVYASSMCEVTYLGTVTTYCEGLIGINPDPLAQAKADCVAQGGSVRGVSVETPGYDWRGPCGYGVCGDYVDGYTQQVFCEGPGMEHTQTLALNDPNYVPPPPEATVVVDHIHCWDANPIQTYWFPVWVCDGKPEHCLNRVKDADEEGRDCGGADCLACTINHLPGTPPPPSGTGGTGGAGGAGNGVAVGAGVGGSGSGAGGAGDPPPPYCGDGVKDPDETLCNCPEDLDPCDELDSDATSIAWGGDTDECRTQTDGAGVLETQSVGLLQALGSRDGTADGEMRIGPGVSLEDTGFGRVIDCLSIAPGREDQGVEVCLRYQTSRYSGTFPDSRPGSRGVGTFTYVGFSRRLSGWGRAGGNLWPWEKIPSDPATLPPTMTLTLENGKLYRFDRDTVSGVYTQSGAGTDDHAAQGYVLNAANVGALLIGMNQSAAVLDAIGLVAGDVAIKYTDGSLDVYSGRTGALKVHVDQFGTTYVVAHRIGGSPLETMSPSTYESKECGAGARVKRISAWPRAATSSVAHIDLKYTKNPDSAGQFMRWELTELEDGAGRKLTLGRDAARDITSLTKYAGNAAEQITTLEYNQTTKLLSKIKYPSWSPTVGSAETNDITLTMTAPTSAGPVVVTQSDWSGHGITYAWTGSDLLVTEGAGAATETTTVRHEQALDTTLLADKPMRITGVLRNNTTTGTFVKYDATKRLPSVVCEPRSTAWSSGDAGTATNPAAQCKGFVYDDDRTLKEVWGRNAQGAAVKLSSASYLSVANGRFPLSVSGPASAPATRSTLYDSATWGAAGMATVTPTVETDPAGKTVSFDWCDGTGCDVGALEAVTDEMGAKKTFSYDVNTGALSVVESASKLGEGVTRDARGCVTELVDENGIKTVFQDVAHDCQPGVILEAAGTLSERRTEITYDEARQVKQIKTDAAGSDGATVTFDRKVVDGRGTIAVVKQVHTGNDDYDAVVTEETAYDAAGRVVSKSTTEAGTTRTATVEYTFNQDGAGTRRVTVKNGLNQATVFFYDSAGRMVKEQDPAGDETTREYFPNGLLKKVTRDAGGVNAAEEVITYADDGLVERTKGPDGHYAQYEYDERRRLTSVTLEGLGAEGDVEQTFTYDDKGRLTKKTITDPPNGPVTLEYVYEDARNGTAAAGGDRVKQVKRNGMVIEEREHEPSNWSVCRQTSSLKGGCAKVKAKRSAFTLSRTQPPLSFKYDELGRLIEVTAIYKENGGPNDAEIYQYVYDGLGRLVMTLAQNGGKGFAYGYDSLGRKREECDTSADTPCQQWDFAVGDELAQFIDINDDTTTYTRDLAGRPTGIAYLSGNPSRVAAPGVSFVVRPDGLVESMTDGHGTTSYTYDGLKRVLSRTRNGKTLSYTYDARGLVTNMAYPGGQSVTYGHDSRGRLSSMTPFGGPAHEYGYHADGRLGWIKRTQPGSGAIVMTTNFMYDRGGGNDGYRRLGIVQHHRDQASADDADRNAENILKLNYTNMTAYGPGFENMLGRDEDGHVRSILEEWGTISGAGGVNAPSARVHHWFSYDDHHRLLGVHHDALTPSNFDPLLGNPISAVDATNAYDTRGNATSFMGQSLAYDSSRDWVTSMGFDFDGNGNTKTTRQGVNQVENGSLSTGLSGWQTYSSNGGTVSHSASEGRAAPGAIVFNSGGATSGSTFARGALSQPLVAGSVLQIGAWVEGSTAGMPVTLRITENVAGDPALSFPHTCRTATEWQWCAFLWQVPAAFNGKSARLTVRVDALASGQNGLVHVDDAAVYNLGTSMPLLSNGNLDQGLEAWSVTSAMSTLDPAGHDGAAAMRLERTGGVTPGVMQRLGGELLSGDVYVITFWARGATGNERLAIGLQAEAGGAFNTTTVQLTTQWQQFTTTRTATTGLNRLRIDATIADGVSWVDDVTVQKQ